MPSRQDSATPEMGGILDVALRHVENLGHGESHDLQEHETIILLHRTTGESEHYSGGKLNSIPD
jgi:hypothetical protein